MHYGIAAVRFGDSLSIRLMARVFELDDPPMDKLVLLALADHGRDDGTGCYPSIEKLAAKTSLTRRGTQKIMRRLEAIGRIGATGISGLGTIEYTVTLDEGGEPRSPLFPGGGRTVDAGGANLKTQRGEPGSPESSLTVLREPVAARVLDAKHIEPVEKAVQPFLLTELAAKRQNHRPPWVRGELAEDLYRGIHGKTIGKAFFDARDLRPRDRIAECVNVAVTSLVTARVARLKLLSADEIEKCAVAELLGGLETLELVKDFEARRRHTVEAVTHAVIGVCVRMLNGAGQKAGFISR
jgi:hypothetical protein